MILAVKVRGDKWLTREEFMEKYDAEGLFEDFDPTSPKYSVDEYLDYMGGGKRERQRVIDAIHRKMRYDRDPDRRNDNVDRLLEQFDFGFSAQRAFLRKFKRKYGTGIQSNPRRRRNGDKMKRRKNRDTSNIRMPSSWDMPFREGSVVQTIMFSTKHFDGRQARAWLHKHGFKAPKMDKTANYMRYRQFDPKMFNKDSFRTLEFKKGLLAVVGIPKQKFARNPKRRRNSSLPPTSLGEKLQPLLCAGDEESAKQFATFMEGLFSFIEETDIGVYTTPYGSYVELYFYIKETSLLSSDGKMLAEWCKKAFQSDPPSSEINVNYHRFLDAVSVVCDITKQRKNPKRRRNRWEQDSLGHRGAACKRWEREGTPGCPKGSSRDALVRYRASPRGQAAQKRLFTRIERSTKGYLAKPVQTASGTVTTYYYIVGINKKGEKYLKRVSKAVAENLRR